MTFKRLFLAGLPLDAADGDAVCGLVRDRAFPQSVAFAAPHAWRLARQDPAYADLLSRMSLVLADGRGIAFVARLSGGAPFPATGFEDMPFFAAFFRAVCEGGLALALAGGAPGNEDDVQGRLAAAFPDLRCVTSMHGYGDMAPKVEKIKAAAPDIVVVGMESPRQESFIASLRDAGYGGFVIAGGDFFTHYAVGGARAQAPAWARRWHVDFLYRLCFEPRRAWRRYLLDYPFFYAEVIRAGLEKMRVAA